MRVELPFPEDGPLIFKRSTLDDSVGVKEALLAEIHDEAISVGELGEPLAVIFENPDYLVAPYLLVGIWPKGQQPVSHAGNLHGQTFGPVGAGPPIELEALPEKEYELWAAHSLPMANQPKKTGRAVWHGLQIPSRLAVANVHPDYVSVCVENCCTGSRQHCRLPRGTITFLRQTAGGMGRRAYGVVGVWYYSGRSEPVPRRESLWPAKWGTKVFFEPLVRQFREHWCEDFSVPIDNGFRGHNASRLVQGLVYTKLQGIIVTVHDRAIARNYLASLLSARRAELDREADYMGRKVNVAQLLEHLAEALGSSS